MPHHAIIASGEDAHTRAHRQTDGHTETFVRTRHALVTGRHALVTGRHVPGLKILWLYHQWYIVGVTKCCVWYFHRIFLKLLHVTITQIIVCHPLIFM